MGFKALIEKEKNLPTHGNELIGVRKDQASIFYIQTLSKAMHLLNFWGGAWLEE
nr:hypothetical protein [Planococcus glaciei]